jgi:flagellar motor protein MotB
MKKLTSLPTFLSLLIFLTIQLNGCAQPKKTYTISNKRAIGQLEEAQEFYQRKDLRNAIKLLEELVEKEPQFIEAQFMLAQFYDENRETDKAIAPLKAALAIDPKYYPPGWMMLAEAHFYLGQYDEAEQAITKYIPLPKKSAEEEKRAQLILSSCVFAKKAKAHPLPYAPINLGPGVNTTLNEYYPCLTIDEQTLLITRDVPTKDAMYGHQEDFYLSKKTNNTWNTAVPVQGINTIYNEGAPSLSADGQTMIFTACQTVDGSYGGDRTGSGSCDLFYSTRVGDDWTQVKNLGSAINSGLWESQPSFSADGQTLYFIRGQYTPHGPKGQDIYYSYIRDNGQWSVPAKVPGRINTVFEEAGVMVHPDGHTLYFSSNGHSGMGGLDLYVSHMLPNGEWDVPVNLGYPINTEKDENSIHVSAKGLIAMISSERNGGMGGLDIYAFELPEFARPQAVTYVQGVVSDKLSFKKLQAHLELVDLETGKKVIDAHSNMGSGEFAVCLPIGKDYGLTVSKDGYLFHSENFSLKDMKSNEPYLLNVELQKLRANANIVLKNVFFETNAWDLLPASRVELDKLAQLLIVNKDKKVEIGGHTDNVGNDADNQKLSENRAKSVVDYLINKGVARENLSYQGYGESTPISDNSTEIGRAKNRRTEFKIL